MSQRTSGPRPYILLEANYRQLLDDPPRVAVLPWGATEAHNYHLPHGTDVIEAGTLAERAAAHAWQREAKPIVLPTVPFGLNAQQLDQACTISFSAATVGAVLGDVARSLVAQDIDRLVILNAHGGNDFKAVVRDLQRELGLLIVVVDFFRLLPDRLGSHFDEPGDHAGQMETAFMLHVCPDWVRLDWAGEGRRLPFKLQTLRQEGVWSPRPWSRIHPDTGSGNPKGTNAQAGEAYIKEIVVTLSDLLCELSNARKGDLPYL